MAHNMWWFTRPKRSLLSTPQALREFALLYEGRTWSSNGREAELSFEENLERAGIKGEGPRFDRTGGGARTYRAWLRSLGLFYQDKDKVCYLTDAGEALVKNDMPPFEIIKKQVLENQFPSTFSCKWPSSVDDRFAVRPFIFILQLLLDERLKKYLNEKDEIAKVVIEHGISNEQTCVDNVVSRILEYRRIGDESLENNFIDLYKPPICKSEPTMASVVEALRNIVNTCGNWLEYTQLIERKNGNWFIAVGMEEEARELVEKYATKALLDQPENEEYFQGRYGLRPGKTRYTSRRGKKGHVSLEDTRERLVLMAVEEYAKTCYIERVDEQLVTTISEKSGVPFKDTERILSRIISGKYPHGFKDRFLQEYIELSRSGRDKATEFEKATSSIFADVFGLRAEHIGQKGIVPDIVVASRDEKWAGILDTKSYKKKYSISNDHKNRMLEYIERYSEYGLEFANLSFFAYVVSDYGKNINSQLENISNKSGLLGSVITARYLARMVERHQKNPYTHEEIREIFSVNRAITLKDID
jgi:hypothetical protein